MQNKKILVAGNKSYGLAKEIYKLYPEAFFASRTTGYDLGCKDGHTGFAELSTEFDIIINCSALYKFHQTVLLDTIFKKCLEKSVSPHIICIGSTTDRVKGGKVWLYNAEKKALRDYCNSLGINGVWGQGPKVSLISFGSLSNVQEKHPDRKCIDINEAAQYIKWLIEQPKNLCINEISIDPMQGKGWYE
jgi:NADP-dependent 3-hydroxy acid dehydrogenase YdfG